MSQPSRHPLEEVLLAIARVDPEPWDYRREALQADLDPKELDGLLELLWLEGLVTGAETSSPGGRGVKLTQLGREVLDDPEARQRLRAGEALTKSQGAIVRNSLRRPITPVVTRTLLVANLAVFAWTLFLAHKHNVLNVYLMGRGDLAAQERLRDQVFHAVGAVTTRDVLRGDWWRLITTCFVHGGLLHIAFNLYALYGAGRFVEQTWGRGRYLLIYLLAGWAGSCVGLPYSPGMVVGASGALCGILAADGVWIYLNGRHLPRSMVRAGRSQFWINVVLLTVISFHPAVSGWGHLGGALAGGATAIVLHFQRFGPFVVRALAPLALLPLAWYPYHYMFEAGAKKRAWQAEERLLFRDEVTRPVNAVTRTASEVYREVVKPVRDRHPERRDEEQVGKAVAALNQQLGDMDSLIARLEKMKFREEEEQTARRVGLEYLQARLEAYREAKRCLTEGKDWKNADEKRFDGLWEKLAEKRKAWENLFE